MTDAPTPAAVEPMTDGELAAERHYASLGGGVTWPASDVARFFATIDALKARALPAPRRYTGGPLEDGLYLASAPQQSGDVRRWDTLRFGPCGYADEMRRELAMALVRGGAFVWLIGPIPTPDLPEEEAANG